MIFEQVNNSRLSVKRIWLTVCKCLVILQRVPIILASTVNALKHDFRTFHVHCECVTFLICAEEQIFDRFSSWFVPWGICLFINTALGYCWKEKSTERKMRRLLWLVRNNEIFNLELDQKVHDKQDHHALVIEFSFLAHAWDSEKSIFASSVHPPGPQVSASRWSSSHCTWVSTITSSSPGRCSTCSRRSPLSCRGSTATTRGTAQTAPTWTPPSWTTRTKPHRL